jgi:hypothetical protein
VSAAEKSGIIALIVGSGGCPCRGGSSSAESVTPPEAMASLARLERATHCLEGSCSILLSYRDTLSTCLA